MSVSEAVEIVLRAMRAQRLSVEQLVACDVLEQASAELEEGPMLFEGDCGCGCDGDPD